MSEDISVQAMETIGLDLGDKYSRYCVLDAEGAVIEEGRVRTSMAGMRRFFAQRERSRVVLEVGSHSPWVSQLVVELDHEALVANATKVRLIHGSTHQDDRLDAERLARLGRYEPRLLSAIEHRGEQARLDLTLVRARDGLVRTRTNLINQVRGMVKPYGFRIPKCSAESFHRRAAEVIPDELQAALLPLLAHIEDLTKTIRSYERRMSDIVVERYPETELLEQIDGVGPVTSLAFLLTIDDPSRFARSRSVGAYLGLTPRRTQSCTIDPQLGITHAGDAFVRRLLVQCAHHILRENSPDSALKRHGEKIAARGGKNAKKRAVVAVARKLAVLMHRLLVTGMVYERFPAREAA